MRCETQSLGLKQGVGSMITIPRDSLLLAPAVVAVGFMLWFLVMLWKDEHRKHHSMRGSERRSNLSDSTASFVSTTPARYSGRQ